jgi:gas vesicle structural protein
MSQQIQTEQIGRSLSLFDLIDRILDKGLVIDAYISVTVVGIELLVIRARIVVASVETFLRYCAAMGLYGEPGGVLKRADRREVGYGNRELQSHGQHQHQQHQQQQQQQQQNQQQQLNQLLQQLQQPLQQLTQPQKSQSKKQ